MILYLYGFACFAARCLGSNKSFKCITDNRSGKKISFMSCTFLKLLANLKLKLCWYCQKITIDYQREVMEDKIRIHQNDWDICNSTKACNISMARRKTVQITIKSKLQLRSSTWAEKVKYDIYIQTGTNNIWFSGRDCKNCKKHFCMTEFHFHPVLCHQCIAFLSSRSVTDIWGAAWLYLAIRAGFSGPAWSMTHLAQPEHDPAWGPF
jgi:hypothetical protein